MKSIFDRSFRYTPSAETDLRKTFARVRRQLRDEQDIHALVEAEAKSKVSPIRLPSKNTAIL